MKIQYKTIEGRELSPDDAIALPVGTKFTLDYGEGARVMQVSVLRAEAEQWLAWRQFADEVRVDRIENGFFDPHQTGHSPQPTLHQAIYAKLGPFNVA